MAPKFALFTKGSNLPLNKGFKNMFELLQSCAQPSKCPFELGFHDTSTLVGHFVSSPREREKRDRRDSRRDEREE